MKQTADPSTSLHDIAHSIIRKMGLINSDRCKGSVIAGDGKAWRCDGSRLTEVSWSEYERAVNSSDRNDWPPYTINFSHSQPLTDQTVLFMVTTNYDRGICEESRGGNEAAWTMEHQYGQWQVLGVEQLMSWD